MIEPGQHVTTTGLVDALVNVIHHEASVRPGAEAPPRVAAQARLAELLDAWHRQASWHIPSLRDSPFDRARRDPLFAALVQQLYHLMASGEGQFTPTEVREAAMLAHMMLEERRPVRFVRGPDGTVQLETRDGT